MAISLLGFGLLVPGGRVVAQTNSNSLVPTPYPAPSTSIAPSQPTSVPGNQPVKTLQFISTAQPPLPASAPALGAAAQPPGGKKTDQKDQDKAGTYSPKGAFDTFEYRNLREFPALEVLTRLESEAALKERMRQDLLRSGERIAFPEEPVLAKAPYAGRSWLPLTKLVEPNFVCHSRTLFAEPNLERGVWDLGVLTPVLAAGKFYWDVALMPYNAAVRPSQQYDCSAGKCLPGDPTPFYLYPVEFSLTGLTAEAGVVTALFFLFP